MALTFGINNNIAAINTRSHLNFNNRDLGMRLERLSSGMRINSAKDDAAGLSISEGFRAQISGLAQGVRNTEMGANMVQVAEGSLNEVSAMLIRMRELAVQSATGTVTNTNREAIQAEQLQLKEEIDRIVLSTVYNDKTLLTGLGNTVTGTTSATAVGEADGVTDIKISGAAAGTYTITDNVAGELSMGNGVVSQTISISPLMDDNSVATGTTSVANFDRLGIQLTLVGEKVIKDAAGDFIANSGYTYGDLHGNTIEIQEGSSASFQVGSGDRNQDRVDVSLVDMRANGEHLNLDTVSMGTQTSARDAIAKIDLAIERVARQRGNLGAILNGLQHTVQFTENSIEGNTATESTIRDADIAVEVSRFTRIQILTQTGTAMLSQANSNPLAALSLLQ